MQVQINTGKSLYHIVDAQLNAEEEEDTGTCQCRTSRGVSCLSGFSSVMAKTRNEAKPKTAGTAANFTTSGLNTHRVLSSYKAHRFSLAAQFRRS